MFAGTYFILSILFTCCKLVLFLDVCLKLTFGVLTFKRFSAASLQRADALEMFTLIRLFCGFCEGIRANTSNHF